jgi:hypothetical protein
VCVCVCGVCARRLTGRYAQSWHTHLSHDATVSCAGVSGWRLSRNAICRAGVCWRFALAFHIETPAYNRMTRILDHRELERRSTLPFLLPVLRPGGAQRCGGGPRKQDYRPNPNPNPCLPCSGLKLFSRVVSPHCYYYLRYTTFAHQLQVTGRPRAS